jgi:DNA-binding response OmpR family regulator
MNAEARAIALNRGATEVLAKPFELAQLRGAISRCLGQDR